MSWNRWWPQKWSRDADGDETKATVLPPPPGTGTTFGLPSYEERSAAVPTSAVSEEAYVPRDTARMKVEEAEGILKLQHGKFAEDLDKLKTEAEKARSVLKDHYLKQIEYTKGIARNAIAELEKQNEVMQAEVQSTAAAMESQKQEMLAELDEVCRRCRHELKNRSVLRVKSLTSIR